MQPIFFKGMNSKLGAPQGMPDCAELPIRTNGQVCQSIWLLTPEEVQQVRITKQISIMVYSGPTQPPIFPQVVDNVDYPPALPPLSPIMYEKPIDKPDLEKHLAGAPPVVRASFLQQCAVCKQPKALHLEHTDMCPVIENDKIKGFTDTVFLPAITIVQPEPEAKTDDTKTP